MRPRHSYSLTSQSLPRSKIKEHIAIDKLYDALATEIRDMWDRLGAATAPSPPCFFRNGPKDLSSEIVRLEADMTKRTSS
jgi:hypothetical protein